jgi:hypothetical protein
MGVRRLYKAVSPYPHQAVLSLDYSQLVDVVFVTHWDYPVYKVTRHSNIDWRYTVVAFGPTISPPGSISAAASMPNSTGANPVTHSYVATALSSTSPVQESRASAAATCSNDLTLAGNYNTVTLPSLPVGTDYWIVYKLQGGAHGYVGHTKTTTFRDGPPPIQPILSDTPPEGDDPFNAVNKYPAKVGLHQQRLFFGKTREVPNGTWFTRTADYENMDKARPVVKADDAGAFALATSEVNAVKHLISMDDLILMTGDNIFAVSGAGDNSVITPGSISPKRQNGRGVSELKPLVIDSVLFYEPAMGSTFRSLGYTFEIEGYKSDDVSIFSEHLFKGYTLTSMCFIEEPYSAIVVTRNDGIILCFTWQLEQDVWGWTRWETDGFIEQVCAIPEDGYSRLYALIRRTINGIERRMVERLALEDQGEIAAACHLDCSVTQVYDPPQTYIDQLWHLEGTTVSLVFDGNVSHGHVVANGRVDIPQQGDDPVTATIITAGLRYSGEIETLPAALMTQQGSVQSNRQQIDEIVVRAKDTRLIHIGASGSNELDQMEPGNGEDLGDLIGEGVLDYKVPAAGDWKDTSSVIVRQVEPLPAYILGVFASMKVSPK